MQEIIFVMGGPGSGKGTHCKRLEEKTAYHHISTGDLVRSIVKEAAGQPDSNTVKMIRDTIKKGELLDDKMIIDLVAEEMKRYPHAAGFLIDGCPRTLNQLALFEKTICPCDKVMYFNTSEEVMKQRMLHRGEVEHREDDNEVTIAKRIRVYNELTIPVIQQLKATKGGAFITIDSSGSMEEVSESVEAAMAKTSLTSVNFFTFLYHYFTSGNFYKAVDSLEQQYHNTEFRINLPYVTLFYIIQNKADIKKILSANTLTGYQNHHFDLSHGHDLNINATQAFLNAESLEKNLIWKTIHSAFAQCVGDQVLINKLIGKHIRSLFAKPTFDLDIGFENFMLNFWCEYLFGPKVNANEFKETRQLLLSTLRYTFYDSRLKNIPYIGAQVCQLYRYLKKNELAQIDQSLTKFILQADSGLIYQFKQQLQQSHFPANKIDQAVLDNTFDFILVFDFIHNALYETFVAILKAELDETNARKNAYSEGLKNAYLFPFRVRVPQQPIALSSVTLEKGGAVYINLLKSGLHHSFGPRSCIGIGVTNWIKEAIWKYIEGMQLRIINTTYPEERAKLAGNPDVPISPERYQVRWQYPRDYLQKALQHYPFKGVDKFYDVLKIYENPVLTGYIVASFVTAIEKLNLDSSNLCIATPEVRGIPAAAMVAEILQVPLVMIRKAGKIPGEVISKNYATAYSEDVLEISTHSDLKNRDVILIDDGIASGGTTLTCCDLIEQVGGKIKMILGVINHTYKEKTPVLQQYNVQTLFDFSKEKEIPQWKKASSDYSSGQLAAQTSGLFSKSGVAASVISPAEVKRFGIT